MIRRALVVLLGLLGLLPLAPLRTGAAQAPLRFRHLGVADGLPSALVASIARDQYGVMWIGTGRGLARYDGHRFRVYQPDPADPRALPGSHVDQVHLDRHGVLWIVTAAGGLSRYEPARDGFTTYLRPSPARPAVTQVADDPRGVMWVGTVAGLYRFDRRTGRETRVPLPPAVGTPDAGPYVMALHVDRVGRVWAATRTGLYQLDSAGATPRLYPFAPGDPAGLPDSVVLTVAHDRDGGVWVGTMSAGAARLDPATGRFRHFRHRPGDSNSLAADRVVRVVADVRGRGIWLGTENGGLDHYDPAANRFTHHRYSADVPSGVASNSVWSLYQDNDGVLWVGTFSGGLSLSVPNDGALRRYAVTVGDPAGLSYDAVQGFAQDAAGRVWVATDGGGLNQFDPATGRFARYTSHTTNLPVDAVTGVYVDGRDRVWAATWGAGVLRFDPARGRFHRPPRRGPRAAADDGYEVCEDAAGRLWAGAEPGMVAELDPARGTLGRRFRVSAPGLEPSSVLALRPLADGRLAVALRDGGVTLLDPRDGRTTHFVAPQSGALAWPNVFPVLGHNSPHDARETEPGVLWVATAGGLDRLDVRRPRAAPPGEHYGTAHGLPSEYVTAVLPDGRGRLWVSSDRGLARVDPRLLGRPGRGAAPGAVAGAVRTFTHADGVQPGEFLMRSGFRARDGALYFGGNQGFTVVRPWLVADTAPAPRVAITGVQLFNRPVRAGAPGSPLRGAPEVADTLTLGHGQNVVTLEFAAPDYAAPRAARYAYRLDGFDADWQEVGSQHEATYTNLAPGRYTFRVRATRIDGLWDGPGTALVLVVTPPWWGTWWWRSLVTAAAAWALWALARFRERRRVEVALSAQALRDPLTGLANRTLFRDRVAHALARAARGGGGPPGEPPARAAVLFLDLDGFKAVNDSLGHAAGDRLLVEVAARLLNATRGCDTVARLGGDEFAVLLENARGAGDAAAVAERIAHVLRAPVSVDGAAGDGERTARVAASVGIAFAEPGVDADALLRNADAAMYRAKGEGKGRHAVFDPSLVAAAAERLEVERDLARALEAPGPDGAPAGFALAYQPVVDLATGAVAGAEALVRWQRPGHGAVSPARFIPVAEASGLVVELGRWVLEAACREAAAWPAGPGGAPAGVSVNVSGRQLAHPALATHVVAALAASGLDPARLTLEITETVLMRDTDAALGVLRALKALGVRLAIDDFGTGYSSLRYLQQFPVDVLKIDKSFVDGVARGRQEAAFARTIVALGETLALRTVAEGVEEPAQAEALRAMGCAYGQGYLFARPAEAAALRARLAADAAGAATTAPATAPAAAGALQHGGGVAVM